MKNVAEFFGESENFSWRACEQGQEREGRIASQIPDGQASHIHETEAFHSAAISGKSCPKRCFLGHSTGVNRCVKHFRLELLMGKNQSVTRLDRTTLETLPPLFLSHFTYVSVVSVSTYYETTNINSRRA